MLIEYTPKNWTQSWD